MYNRLVHLTCGYLIVFDKFDIHYHNLHASDQLSMYVNAHLHAGGTIISVYNFY